MRSAGRGLCVSTVPWGVWWRRSIGPSSKSVHHLLHASLSREDSAVPTPRYNCPLHTFLAIKSAASKDDSTSIFWIVDVFDSYRGKMSKVTSLRIQWYPVANNNYIHSGAHMSSRVEKPDDASTDCIDRVETESVLINFKSLNRTKSLPENIINHLRSVR